MYVLIFTEWIGLHFGQFFHKLIFPPLWEAVLQTGQKQDRYGDTIVANLWRMSYLANPFVCQMISAESTRIFVMTSFLISCITKCFN
jgi:hypothetical protein